VSSALKYEFELDQLISGMREGEVFLITYIIGGGVQANISGTWDSLLGSSPFKFFNLLSLSPSYTKSFIWQTAITRTKNGIEVSLKDYNQSNTSISGGASFFLNDILKASQTKNEIPTAENKVYTINYNPDASETSRYNRFTKSEVRSRLNTILISLLSYQYSPDALNDFPEVPISSDLNFSRKRSSIFMGPKS
jgi:hypothetical protein